MAVVLAATSSGCRVFEETGEAATQLHGREVSFLTREREGSTLAVVDSQEIWRRKLCGEWSRVARVDIPLQSLTSIGQHIFAGGLNEPVILRLGGNGEAERLSGFDRTPGREDWFAGGPPLGVRSLALTADGGAILAGVHVGGIPRSTDGGATWAPTLPVMFDVHEVCAHPVIATFVAAASAVGLCLSEDGGAAWRVLAEGLDVPNSLAVAVTGDEVLFSVQDGPFASRSQIWRWRQSVDRLEQVLDGLPEWLEGKVDTGHIAAGDGCAAVLDGGGNLWLSSTGSTGWRQIASHLGYVFGIALL